MNQETLSLVALSYLPKVGPARLRWLLENSGSAEEALELLKKNRLVAATEPPRGVNQSLLKLWVESARKLSLESISKTLDELQASVLTSESPEWPFHGDPEPPMILFCKGDLAALAAPAVAVVGTRRCTSVGRRVATDFGSQLADAGVSVVSGLALGIDAATHRGCLASSGKPIAVVGSGVDVPYPNKNTSLWSEVAESGLLVSEFPPGTAPARWRFPARNRIIAALSSAVVVVESHDRGGSLSTVEEALARDLDVFAVPGSVLSSASSGSNKLLADGAIPALSANDVTTQLFGFGSHNENFSPDTESGLEKIILAEARAGSGTVTSVFDLTDETAENIFLAVQKLVSENKVRLKGEHLHMA